MKNFIFKTAISVILLSHSNLIFAATDNINDTHANDKVTTAKQGNQNITPIDSSAHSKKHCTNSGCSIVPEPGAMSNDSLAQSREFDVIPLRRPVAVNSEMLLPTESFTFWGLDHVKQANSFEGKTVTTEKAISDTVSVASKEQVKNIQFVSGKHFISKKYVDNLRNILKKLKHKNHLRLHFIGHTDSEKLSAKSKAIYGDNYGLGRSRAKRTALFFKEELNLPDSAISYEGKGPDEPIASNDTPEGMALNRRVEIQVWYDKAIAHQVVHQRFIADNGLQRTQVCRRQSMCQRVEKKQTFKRVVLEHAVDAIRFDVASSDIPASFIERLKMVLNRIKDKNDIQLKFIGHTDNQRLSPRAKKLYQDNKGLSMARAKRVADYFRKKLNLPDKAVHYTGKGLTQPLGDNATPQGRALNRRVDVEISYKAPDSIIDTTVAGDIVQCPAGKLPENMKRLGGDAQQPDPFKMTPWRISVDGTPIISEQPRHGADTQRCTDIALEKAKLQLHYDRLLSQPKLNLAVWPNIAINDETLYFRGWSNYPHWIKRAEVILYTLGYENQKNIIERIELNKDMETRWQVQAHHTDKLWYSLRVYDSADEPSSYFDETSAKSITVANEYPAEKPDPALRETALRAGYGKNSLQIQNIPITGGTITANGIDVPAGKNVWVMGQPVPLDKNGAFIAQQIIPDGLHTAEIAVLDNEGNGDLLWRDLQLKKNDWFYVGIADISLSLNHSNGSAALVTGDSNINDNTSATGRIAMYAKGKIDDKYTLTTSLDSREEPLSELFSNFHKKDPASLLRRLDSEDYYPTFGDDSTLYEDAPTQGKFYIKLDDGKSHALWGNFKLNLNENELAVINRGLYGGHLRYQSAGFTLSGERKTRVDFFAAEPGTIPAYEEFRGTGGSLYYLKHRDITRGSEQIRIEVRDKDSGIILSSTSLLSGQDYDMDELQGIVLLTKPLASTATDDNLVRSSSLSGNPVSMVVNYEYVPGFNELNNIAVGGRIEHWLSNGVQLGATVSNQDQTGGKQKLGSVDVTMKRSDSTWLKVTAAQSDGPGIGEQKSVDGGFGFNQTPNTANHNKANAIRVEGTVSLQEMGVDVPLQSSVYWQKRDAGFSSPGQQTNNDATETGVKVSSQMTKKTEVEARFNQQDKTNGLNKQAIEADLKQQISEHWKLSGGVRHDDINNRGSSTLSNQGQRTDLLVGAYYDFKNTWVG